MNVKRMHETERFQKVDSTFWKLKTGYGKKVASTFLTQRQAAYKKPA
jgi:hypothetical protein